MQALHNCREIQSMDGVWLQALVAELRDARGHPNRFAMHRHDRTTLSHLQRDVAGCSSRPRLKTGKQLPTTHAE
jgi:hypothetical protein